MPRDEEEGSKGAAAHPAHPTALGAPRNNHALGHGSHNDSHAHKRHGFGKKHHAPSYADGSVAVPLDANTGGGRRDQDTPPTGLAQRQQWEQEEAESGRAHGAGAPAGSASHHEGARPQVVTPDDVPREVALQIIEGAYQEGYMSALQNPNKGLPGLKWGGRGTLTDRPGGRAQQRPEL